jgi:hypothetical protein
LKNHTGQQDQIIQYIIQLLLDHIYIDILAILGYIFLGGLTKPRTWFPDHFPAHNNPTESQ